MKAIFILLVSLLLSVSCVSEAQASNSGDSMIMDERRMTITIGEKSASAVMENNSSVDALFTMLENGPITINMNEYGAMERVGSLGQSLPRNDRSISTGPGDIILYQGSNFVIYYDTNSWNFTRLGRIVGMSDAEIRTFLGAGRGGLLRVTLSK